MTGDPSNGTVSYAYDPLGRLTGYDRAGATPETYGWAAVPNRTSVTVGPAPAVTTSFDAANRPTADSAGATYANTPDGQLSARPGQTLEWDSLGRLVRVRRSGDNAVLASYAYDPLDRLASVTHPADGVGFRYVGLTASVAQLLDGTGAVAWNVANGWAGEHRFDWSGGGVAQRFYGSNGHHDVTWTAGPDGSVTGSVRYDPWGTVVASTGGPPPDFRYQGSWADPATDLTWMVTRWYAPSLGRFISEDSLLGTPADPASRQLYAYGEGDPVGRWDPDGRQGCRYGGEDCEAIAARQRGNSAAESRHRQYVRALWARDHRIYWRYDKILAFMTQEMQRNARGHRFGVWDDMNRCDQNSVRTWTIDEGCYNLAAINNGAVLGKFFSLVHGQSPELNIPTQVGWVHVTPGALSGAGDWDHKRKLRTIAGAGDKGFYTPVRGDSRAERIFYDIWSNIHYGYVGRSHGIPARLLLNVQYDPKYPHDDLSTSIGIDLWARHRSNLSALDIQNAIVRNMPAYRSFHHEGPKGRFEPVLPGLE